jgi:hypothetical protein
MWAFLRRASLFAAVLALLPPGAAVADDWLEPAPGPLDASAPDTATIASVGGVPHVAWGSLDDSKLYVKKLTAGGWTLVGGGSATTGFATPHVYIADFAGSPYVTYQQWIASGGPNNIHVKGLVGTTWTDIGSSLNFDTTHEARNPVIANVTGTPYVAFNEANASPPGSATSVYVKSFSSPNWNLVGGGALNIAAGANAHDPFIASVGGTPYVTWEEDGKIYVKAFSAGSWSEPDAGALNIDSGHDADLPFIADIGGVPYVSFQEDNGSGMNQTFVKRLTSGSWTQVGSGPAQADLAHDAGSAIANVGGQPYVGLNQSNGSTYTSVVRRFTGTDWTTVGSPVNVDPTNNAIEPKLADVGGTPYVVWREGDGGCAFGFNPSNSCQVFVKRLAPAPVTPSGLRPTATSVSCSYSPVSHADSPGPPGECSVKVSDTGAKPGSTPSGVVKLFPTTGGLTATSCKLSGGTCSVGYLLNSPLGKDTILATYPGDSTHTGSSDSSALLIPPVVPGMWHAFGNFRLSPPIFIASATGPEHAKRRQVGTRVSYTLNAPAVVRFTVQRRVEGRRAVTGKGRKKRVRCRRATKRNRRSKPCARFVKVRGSFTLTGKRGSNSFKFRGRIGGKTLKPGRYRLVATPTLGPVVGKKAIKAFRVRRR